MGYVNLNRLENVISKLSDEEVKKDFGRLMMEDAWKDFSEAEE